MKSFLIFLSGAVFLISNSVHAATGASFLKIGAGARALGMGSAFTAVADDATAIYWNPGGLARMEGPQASAMHTEWITDIRFDHLAYAQPTRVGTIAGSVAYLSQGSLEKRGENREKRGTFQAQDVAFTLSLARPLTFRSSYGLNVKWIEQRIDNASASGIAFDAGWIRKTGNNVNLGLSIQNLGPGLRLIDDTYRLPFSVTGGFQYQFFDGISLGADFRRYVYERRNTISLGTEYWLMNRVALRAGYNEVQGGTTSRLGQWTGIHMGLGLKTMNTQMDYALTPSAEFGNTHRLSFSYQIK
ncbi:MAG: PorV/PorQ family protein [Elusimicrobia bacterium]|nr:PorV/PorQ family protein [Elusimicrobiota bacterium]